MSFLIHESGAQIKLTNDQNVLRERSDVQKEISELGLTIGNVTLTRMMEGKLAKSSGWEYIETIQQEEQQELQEAVAEAKAKAEDVSTTAQEPEVVAKPEVEQTATTENAGGEVEAVADAKKEAEGEIEVDSEKADAIRKRMLGTTVGAALTTAQTSTDKKEVEGAIQVLKESGITKADMTEERSRRHNKREDTIAEARKSEIWKEVIEGIESGLTPAVALNYAHPDLRWLEFAIQSKIEDPSKPFVRTNPYVDVARIATGGFGFSLYVKGKSATKRQKIKEENISELVKAINSWLPEAMKENGIG